MGDLVATARVSHNSWHASGENYFASYPWFLSIVGDIVCFPAYLLPNCAMSKRIAPMFGLTFSPIGPGCQCIATVLVNASGL